MISTSTALKTIGVLFIGCATTHASDWLENFYVHGDLGPSFTQDSRAYTRTLDVSGSFSRSSGTATFDTEIRGDLSLGYDITKAWAVELEAGVIWDPYEPASSEFYQIPVTFNLLYQVPLNSPWKPYFGAGVGEVVSILGSVRVDSRFAFPLHSEDTSVALGYQAEAGIKYAISHHIDLGLGYKFLGVGQNSWNLNSPLSHERVTIQNLYTHTVLLSFNCRF